MSIASLIKRTGPINQAPSDAPPSERERSLMDQLAAIERQHPVTIEHLLKFGSGLAIGRTPVTIQRRDGSQYSAVVEISIRGVVRLIRKPDQGDMYTSWHRITGDSVKAEGAPIVWGVRDPDLLKMFDNPVKVIIIPGAGK